MSWVQRMLLFLAAASTNACSTSSVDNNDAGGSGSTITVDGTILTYEGLPAAYDTVSLTSGGFSASQRTDITGHFSISGVPVPYDLFVSAPVGSTGSSARYIGLTRPDPTVSDLLSRVPVPRSANLSGQLLGGSYPEDSGVQTRLLFASPEDLTSAIYTLSNVEYANDGSIDSGVQWNGPATTTGALYALQFASAFQENAYLPVQYMGFGSLNGVSLVDQGALTGQTVSLSPVAADTMSVTVAPPDGYTMYEQTVQLALAGNFPMTLVLMGVDPNIALTFAVPDIPNTSLAVSADGTNDEGAYVQATRSGLSPDASVVLTFPEAPVSLTPADGGAGVGAFTTFSWSEYANGMYMLAVIPEKYGTAYFVFTAATSATVPDLSSLPANHGFYWFVVGAAPLASIDDLATPDHYQAFYNGQLHSPFPGLLPYAPSNLTVGVTPERTFTP